MTFGGRTNAAHSHIEESDRANTLKVCVEP
jgi:hypothetical protein